MDMGLKKTFSYKTKLYLIVNVFFWMLVFVFVSIQYAREREYQAMLLDARLQTYNSVLLRKYAENGSLDDSMVARLMSDREVRVTLLDRKGNVLYDNLEKKTLDNHRSRPEINNALLNGHSYTVRRLSQTDNREYFYSATADSHAVVRCALPYNVTLANVLKADFAYIWIFLGATVIVNIILYFAISRLSLGVKILQDIANQAKKGNVFDYDPTQLPNDELGEVSNAIVAIYQDLKRTASERDQNLEEALFEEREKMRIKHQLTSNINHELKTPVQAIRGCFETLLENNLDPDMQRRLLESGYNNTMRLTNLLQDVALITQITDAKNTLPVERVDVGEVVASIREEIERCTSEMPMRINVSIPAGVVVEGNRRLIDSIFRNLVNNSIAYSGGRDIFILMTKETDEEYWFDYYDNGTGVEAKHLTRIFERFYRIESGRSRKSGGTGLGLSIVRNSVQFHGGEITAQNRLYAGLEFIFSFKKTNKQL